MKEDTDEEEERRHISILLKAFLFSSLSHTYTLSPDTSSAERPAGKEGELKEENNA